MLYLTHIVSRQREAHGELSPLVLVCSFMFYYPEKDGSVRIEPTFNLDLIAHYYTTPRIVLLIVLYI